MIAAKSNGHRTEDRRALVEPLRFAVLALSKLSANDLNMLRRFYDEEADKGRNLQLLKEHGWFDIPVVYNNNRRAILAMEMGTPGKRAFADAFTAWKQ
jgi:hypothetical protein